jgi:hypothetical protein
MCSLPRDIFTKKKIGDMQVVPEIVSEIVLEVLVLGQEVVPKAFALPVRCGIGGAELAVGRVATVFPRKRG